MAKTIQGKKARLQDCKNICKGSVGPLICSPSLAKSVSEPTLVDNKNDKLRVENIKVDMREPENGYNLTRMEYRKDTTEFDIDGESVCVAHRPGDKHMSFPKNTSHYKTHPSALRTLVCTEEEDSGSVNRMLTLNIN